MAYLCVIVPVYNEAGTIRQIVEKINSIPVDKEIIIVDDGSSDGTDKILREIRYPNIKTIHHTRNRGKGAAFLTGLTHAQSEYAIIQDADLEYDPKDYGKLIDALKLNNADLVLGARFTESYRGLFAHRLGNKFLTALFNFLFNAKINDYSTCYKLASLKIWKELNLRAKGFDIEAEIMCNAFKKKLCVVEVPVSYNPRTYKEGKKIRWKDGIWAIFSMLKYRFLK